MHAKTDYSDYSFVNKKSLYLKSIDAANASTAFRITKNTVARTHIFLIYKLQKTHKTQQNLDSSMHTRERKKLPNISSSLERAQMKSGAYEKEKLK